MLKEETVMIIIISILSGSLGIAIIGGVIYVYKNVNIRKMGGKEKTAIIIICVVLGLLGSGLITVVIIYVLKYKKNK